jgi:hypothetical protein
MSSQGIIFLFIGFVVVSKLLSLFLLQIGLFKLYYKLLMKIFTNLQISGSI